MRTNESGVPTGVGATALGVAQLRAQETARPDRLFVDSLAADFVAAAGWDPNPPEQAESASPGPAGSWTWASMQTWIATRTKFFDDFLLDASKTCRQVVLLGAGLDSRAFRLNWPPATRLVELDTAAMVAFKEPVIVARGATPTCSRTVAVADLLSDWTSVLSTTGWQREQPTVWLVEGVVSYLTEEQNELLLGQVSAHSHPKSKLALTAISQAHLTPGEIKGAGTPGHPPGQGTPVGHLYRSQWRSGLRADPATWLATHGWQATARDAAECAERYGRQDDDGARPPVWAITATKI